MLAREPNRALQRPVICFLLTAIRRLTAPCRHRSWNRGVCFRAHLSALNQPSLISRSGARAPTYQECGDRTPSDDGERFPIEASQQAARLDVSAVACIPYAGMSCKRRTLKPPDFWLG